MSRPSKDSLDDSWVYNQIDEDELSWSERDGNSLSDEDVIPEPLKPSPRSTRNIAQKRPSPSNSKYQEPEFIMPSISHAEQPRQRAVPRRQQPITPARKYDSRTSIERGTPQKDITKVRTDTDDRDFTAQTISFVGQVFQTIFEIVFDAFKLLRKPISWLLAIYLVLAFLQLAQNSVVGSFYSALSPICRIPGSKFLNLPVCQPFGENRHRLPAGASVPDPEFDALMDVQSQFESIMDDTAVGLSLPIKMKRSETSIRDLRQVVRFSHLPSKHELGLEFDGFVETARIASYDLQKFNSHVGRAVDIVLSTARWTQRMLDDMGHEENHRGIIPALISDTILAPFKPLKFTESRLLDQYVQHAHVISSQIEELIDEAQTLLSVLQNLEDRLEVIQSIALRDNLQVQGTRDELLAQLWTHLGGNRAQQRKVDKQISLLNHVHEYRKLAFEHIANTIIKLQGMGAELEELRSRVDSPGVLLDAGVKHVPLAVHIENIQLGVERLEIGRQRARELEKAHNREVLDRPDVFESTKHNVPQRAIGA